MSALRTLVQDLELQGVRFTWGQRGPCLAGNLGKVTLDYREALKPHAEELRALSLWRYLQDLAEQKFGHPAARLYPFQANPAREFWRAPKLRTPLGCAHLVQVLPDVCRVARASEVKEWRQARREQGKSIPFPGCAHEVPIADVWPPRKPPSDQTAALWS